MGKGSLPKNNIRLHLEYLRGGRGAHQTIWDDSGKVQHQSTASDLQVILFGSEEMIS